MSENFLGKSEAARGATASVKIYVPFLPETIVKVAHLARLAIPEERLEGYTHTISDILNLVAEMNKVNTDEVSPLSNPLEILYHISDGTGGIKPLPSSLEELIKQGQYLRDDVVTETNQREVYQSIAPRVEDGLYLVPKVIE
jgi:aspartyl-tRNA(Asn)/glutamyl-tRNA(Gln) amidotransferase subunit C